MANLKGAVDDFRRGNLIGLLTDNFIFLLLGLFILIMLMLLIHVPHQVLDIFLPVNVAAAVIIFGVSLTVSDVLKFTTFPPLLLITTAFRVGLNAATLRLVLTEGYAGGVVDGFGRMVGRGDPVVGLFVFLVLFFFLFLVVVKGAERVAEVAARFTLDAMPGIQMQIDADLRSGAITLSEARAQRATLQRRSQMYGAMDGAMKFVKGDAIFALIVSLINLIGGTFYTGMQRGHLSAGDAFRKFGNMTFGDALVSILPAFFITMAAGLLITRVAAEDSETNVGKDIGTQIFRQPRAIAMAVPALIVLGIAIEPARVGLLLVALILGAFSATLSRQVKAQAAGDAARASRRRAAGDEAPSVSLPFPVSLVVGADLASMIDRESRDGRNFADLIAEFKSAVNRELGVPFPPIHVQADANLAGNAFTILLREQMITQGTLPLDKVLIQEVGDNLRALGIDAEEAKDPAMGYPSSWVPSGAVPTLVQTGMYRHGIEENPEDRGKIKIHTHAEVLLRHLGAFARAYAWEFLGHQEVQNMLDQLAAAYPKLVEDVVPNPVPLHRLTEILQRLIKEGVSVRDLRTILESLSQWARTTTDDPVELTELVRQSLGRQICLSLARADKRLVCYTVDAEILATVKDGIRPDVRGRYLGLSPDLTRDIRGAFRAHLRGRPPSAGRAVVMVTEPEVRPFIRRLIEAEFPEAAVLSVRELVPEVSPQPIGVVSVGFGPGAAAMGA